MRGNSIPGRGYKNIGRSVLFFLVLIIVVLFSKQAVFAECNHEANYDADMKWKVCDDNSHYWIYTCKKCGQKITENEPHEFFNGYSYKEHNLKTHYVTKECIFCKHMIRLREEEHAWKKKYNVWSKATLTTKGLISYECKNCLGVKDIKVSWKYGTDYSMSFDIYAHSTVYRKSKSMWVILTNPLKGSVLRVKIGKKVYKKKLKPKQDVVTIKLNNIKKEYGKKIDIKLLYGNRVVGKDTSKDWNYVFYAKNIKKGMTKRQVENLYNWGLPDDTSKASGGWSYWYYDDDSYIGFKKGKVKYWYDSAG